MEVDNCLFGIRISWSFQGRHPRNMRMLEWLKGSVSSLVDLWWPPVGDENASAAKSSSLQMYDDLCGIVIGSAWIYCQYLAARSPGAQDQIR